MNFIKTVAAGSSLLLLGAAADSIADEELCLPTCNDDGTVCTFKFSIDIYAGETGYYHVEGCEGTQPTLGLKAGVKHIFDQTNVTNWFHPLGFAYGPDGVYGLNTELEPTVPDPNGAQQDCGEEYTNPCQHPQYVLNDVPLCTDCSDWADFGLDEYEGVWFHGGRDDWIDAGDFHVEVTVTDSATTEMFYFCHIHNKMSGRIKVLNEDGTQRDTENKVVIPYEYAQIDAFDKQCGTFNVSQYNPENGACEGLTFLCDDDEFHSYFGTCMKAIDCHMHDTMRTHFLEIDATTTFMHQMIPHHQNAVNMAKILLKFNPPSLRCGTAYDGRRLLQGDFDEEFCHDGNDEGNAPAETLLWEIINGQNSQITFMRAWLSDNLQPEFNYCEAKKVPFTIQAKATAGALGAVAFLSLIITGYLLATKKAPVAVEQKDVEAAMEKKDAAGAPPASESI